jgi:hypothetical protein
MSALRDHSLSAAYDGVIAKASFRRPQHEAFEKFHLLIRALGRDLSTMTQQQVADRVSDLGYSGTASRDPGQAKARKRPHFSQIPLSRPQLDIKPEYLFSERLAEL